MATCKVVEEKPLPPPKKYVLEMSEEEAQWVYSALGHCFRGRTDTAFAALQEALGCPDFKWYAKPNSYDFIKKE